MVGRDGITKYACTILLNDANRVTRSDRGSESEYIVFFSDESCILNVTWEVVYCSKRYLLSIHSQNDRNEDGDGIDGTYMRHERIEEDNRNMP